MGESAARRRAFFEAHPRCCFCAGSRLATTRDHQPGRVLFKDRVWPDGFVFPACEPCNQISAPSEKVMALLLHGEGASDDSPNRSRYKSLIESIRREHPDLIDSMLINSANEVRAILRQKGLSRPQGITLRELPVVRLNKDFWTPHFEMFSRKLLLALHYQCFHAPLTRQGRLYWWINNNTDLAAGNIPTEILDLAERIAIPSRNRSLLGEQLLIRWNFVPERNTGLFLALFHRMVLVSGITTETPKAFSEGNRSRMLPPLP